MSVTSVAEKWVEDLLQDPALLQTLASTPRPADEPAADEAGKA